VANQVVKTSEYFATTTQTLPTAPKPYQPHPTLQIVKF